MKRLTVGQHVVEYVAKATNEYGDFGCAVGIGLQELRGDKWELISGVAYGQYSGPNIVAHIASDKSKRWMTKRYLWTIFDYPFNQLKVNRITCMIGPKNAASINLCERLGFERETTLQGAHSDGDLLIYRQWRKDCKWIKLDFGKRFALAA